MNNLTDITIILDRSGSMATIRDDMIGGLNAFFEEQKTVPGEATVSLFQFDNLYETVYEGKPLKDVPPLTPETFVPRGSTALLDALGRTMLATGARLSALPESDRPGKVVLVVVTDGYENSSREFTESKVAEMVKHQQEVYSWQVAFIGANQDAVLTGGSLGIPSTAALNYTTTKEGVGLMSANLSRSLSSYRKGLVGASLNFAEDE